MINLKEVPDKILDEFVEWVNEKIKDDNESLPPLK